MATDEENRISRQPPAPWDFAIFASAQLAAFVGTWMQKTAVGWLAWEMTHSPAWVGAVALGDLFAAFIVGPLAGAVTDRTNPYRLIQFTQGALILNALVLVGLMSTGLITPWLLLAWAIADACIQGFNQPVRVVIIASLAQPGRMGQVIAANSVAANLGRIFGPAVAGVTMLYGSVEHVFIINIALYTVMLAVVRYLRASVDAPRAQKPAASLRSDIATGFRYVRNDARLATVFVLVAAFSFLARPFAEMLPAIAGGSFNGGPGTLATLMIAQGCGALVGAGWLLRPREGVFLLRLAFFSALSISLALILFAFSTDLWLAVAAIAVAGLFHVVCNICMQTTVQTISAPDMRGRTVALYLLLFRAAPALGAFVLGVLAEWMSLQHLIGAAAALFVVVLIFLWPRARAAHGL
ncbi:MAG TPA: MFS transporter [Rhizobiaceae bacterium]